MSLSRVGLDFMGGAMEGAGAGAPISASTGNPYAMLFMAGAGALNRVMAGFADQPAERMQMRLGNQQIAMNDLQIEAQRRASEEERKALRKNRMVQDALSSIFSRYRTLSTGGAP